MPTSRQLQAERTRGVIVAAAAAEFARQGYKAASLSDIAAQFGKPKTALRYHFASKDELALAVAEVQYGVWVRMFDEAREAGLTGLPLLLTILRSATIDGCRSDYAAATVRLLVSRAEEDVPVPPPPFSFRDFVYGCIRQASEEGRLRGDVGIEEAGGLLLNASFGVYEIYRRGIEGEFDVVPRLDALWTSLMTGFGVADPGAVLAEVRTVGIAADGS